MVGHVAPEAARGGPLAIVRDGDRSRSTSTPRRSTSSWTTPSSRARLAAWQPPPLRDAGGVFARYRALVGSASEGAVLLPYATERLNRRNGRAGGPETPASATKTLPASGCALLPRRSSTDAVVT